MGIPIVPSGYKSEKANFVPSAKNRMAEVVPVKVLKMGNEESKEEDNEMGKTWLIFASRIETDFSFLATLREELAELGEVEKSQRNEMRKQMLDLLKKQRREKEDIVNKVIEDKKYVV